MALLVNIHSHPCYLIDHPFLYLFQLDLVGQSVYEFAHPCDHDEVRETLTNLEEPGEQVFFVRLKCTLTSKGRNVNLKSATYKVLF